MDFVVASIAQDGNSTLLKAWCGVCISSDTTLSEFYSELVAGKFDSEPLQEECRRSFVQVLVGTTKKDLTKVSPNAKISDVTGLLGQFIQFLQMPVHSESRVDANGKPSVFKMLIAGARAASCCLPEPLSLLQYPQKNKLKNDILTWLNQNSLGWEMGSTLGMTFVNTLGDALWYIDRNHHTLKQRGYPVPMALQQFSGYRLPEKQKKRKLDESSLRSDGIKAHSASLFNLGLSTYMKKDKWKSIYAAVINLALNLQKYGDFLINQAKRVKEDHAQLLPPADKDSFDILYTSTINPTLVARYGQLHDALLKSAPGEPIDINDYAPGDRRRRFEFVKGLKVPCKSVLYTHSGSGPCHLHFIWRISEFFEEDDILNSASFISKELAKSFPKYHSRALRMEFVSAFGRVTSCKAAFFREAYHRLTGDASAASSFKEAEVDRRINQVLDEEDPELIWDLRTQNSGRPEQFSVFLEQCQKYITSTLETAVDERRHDPVEHEEVITHLATALSVRDLHDEVTKQCPENTPIPSIQWLRLQFWPRRPCAKTASRYTGKLKIKFMVQARQLRAHHVDAHYASAIFRYEKELAIKFRDHVSFVSLDDKHTIKVGEPGCPVASVERGKSVLVAMGKTFTVSDHDFTRLSLSPSVSLVIDVPESIDMSFHRGKVFVTLKENCFQPSSAIRHMAELNKLLSGLGTIKPILLLYTDGGPDHRLTYISVKLTLLAIFLDLDLDFVCAVRTPPHHSWKNPVERIMSILNIAFQGIGCMREEVEHEDALKSCSGLKSIRDLATKIPEIKEEVLGSVEQTKGLMNSLIKRMKLKDTNFETGDPATEEEMTALWENVLKIDDSLTMADRTKQHIKRKQQLQDFLGSHCKTRQYFFSVKKCGTPTCLVCRAPRLPPDIFAELHHLPDPIPEPGSGSYQHFDDLYGKVETTEKFLPSAKATPEKGNKCPFNPTAQTAKNVGTVIQCADCGKWRCMHSKRMLKKKERDELSVVLDSILYSCGSSFQDMCHSDEEGDINQNSVLNHVFVRANLNCRTEMEYTYYSANYEAVCIYCASTNPQQKEGYYPQCEDCTQKPTVPKRGAKK